MSPSDLKYTPVNSPVVVYLHGCFRFGILISKHITEDENGEKITAKVSVPMTTPEGPADIETYHYVLLENLERDDTTDVGGVYNAERFMRSTPERKVRDKLLANRRKLCEERTTAPSPSDEVAAEIESTGGFSK